MDTADSSNMRTHPLINLFRHAIKTFSVKNEGTFAQNFTGLKEVLDNIRAEHVQLDPTFNDEQLWVTGEKAPCTYIEIFEDQNINLSIFILKPGFKMPLHDHPQMHGLLKVLTGTIKLKSYSEIQLADDKHNVYNDKTSNIYKRGLFAKIDEEKICNPESESCILTPDASNYHEIEAIGVPAAFLDILAPPYATLIEEVEPRECRYYKVLQEISTNVVQMEQIPSPKWFYCDRAPYLGPVLT